MNTKSIRFILGWILNIEALLMLLPVATAVVYREEEGIAYALVMAVCAAVGALMTYKKPNNPSFYAKEGFVCTALGWILMSAFGCVPFMLTGEIPSFVDAMFEMVSGFTTTGASVVLNVEELSHCTNMWRCFSHWIGGMGILVFLLAVLPLVGGSNMQLMKAESPGPSVGKLVPKVRFTARILYVLYVALTRARERLILVGSVAGDKPPEAWRGADISQMHTGLDMIAPALIEAGASLTIREEAVRLGNSAWRVFAHVGGAAGELPRRTEDVVLHLLAELAAAPKDEALTRLMNFKPGVRTAVRKTTVSAVLRDEKRAAQEDEPLPDAPLLRLPRFMEEQQMTGAQIGTAFHRMMRMLDLDALRATRDLAAEIDRQRAALLEKGVVSESELAAVHPRLLVRLFASPLGVRMLAAEELHREWAFTYRRETEDGAQLLQGVIDCCFIERGAWVLVDYKTDADAAGAIERHRPQLELYAQALAGITGRPVRERVLYLVRAGMGYQV